MRKIIRTPELIHYGKEIDENGKFIRWIPNPNRTGRNKTSKYSISQILSFYNIKEPFCFFCGRKKEELGEKETLTIDHIIPLNRGGKDIPSNCQILCTACHKLKHWSDLYLNTHLKKFYNGSPKTIK